MAPFSLGLRSSAESAGERVSALNAEINTEIAIVTANCWYKRPVMPGIAAVGIKTAARISAIATTGPPTSSIAFSLADFDHALFDVVLDGLHDDDRVIDDQANCQHGPKSESVLMEKPSAEK